MSCSSAWRSSAPQRTAACKLNPSMSAHSVPARRAKASAFAAVGDQLVVATVVAAQAQEAVRQDAAFEKGVELVPHRLRHAGASCGLKPARRRWRRAAAPQRYSVVCSGRWRS